MPSSAGRRSNRRLAVAAAVALLLTVSAPPPAQAGVIRGVLTMVVGVLEIPRSIVAGTIKGPLLLGTVGGALAGTLRGAVLLTRGALETVVGAVGLAKQYAPLIPIFL